MNKEREGVKKTYMVYHLKKLPAILKAIAFTVTVVSVYAIYYGLSRGFIALAWVGVMSLLVIAIDMQKAISKQYGKTLGGMKKGNGYY